MNELPSATFRKVYAKLTDPTVVTVNGHVIGQWTPAEPAMPSLRTIQRWVKEDREVAPLSLPPGERKAILARGAQAGRDDLLRKINRGR